MTGTGERKATRGKAKGGRTPRQSGARPGKAAILHLRGLDPRPLVLIHQMGKVGSTSLKQSLQLTPWRYRVVHVHSLDRAALAKARAFGRSKGYVPRHIRRGQRIARELEASRRPIHVISLMRDPVARNVSAFFQNLWAYDLPANPAEIPVEALIARFQRDFAHDRPLTWFDQQVKGCLGIDVFAHPFDHQAGRLIASRDNIRLLVLRAEDSDDAKEQAVRAFLDNPRFRLRRFNVSENKIYADIYRRVRERITFDAAYLDRMYDSRLVRHFYTPEEVAAFRRQWEDQALSETG